MLPSAQPDDESLITPMEAITDSGNNQTKTLKLTPLKEKKRDALELAELIYKIYNEYCPVKPEGSNVKENENV